MISGGQYVMTAGTDLMPVWSASNWVMHTLEVSASILVVLMLVRPVAFPVLQVELHIAMLFLVLVLDLSTWMMLVVL